MAWERDAPAVGSERPARAPAPNPTHRRKALKAPEPKGPPKAKAAPKAPQAAAQAAADAAEAEEQQQQQGTPTPAGPSASGGKMRGAKALMALQQGLNPEQQALLLQEQQTAAPTLRRSTVAKTQEAVKERQHREQVRVCEGG